MKKSLLFVAGLCMASAVHAQIENKAGTHFYVQPSLVLAVPGEFYVAVGGAAAIGADFLSRHSVEAEVISFKTEEDHGWIKLDMLPVLLTYKYRVPLTANFSLYGGASAGASFQKVKVAYWSEGETKCAATFGLTGGLRFAFNEYLGLDAGVKILRLQETSYTTEGDIELFHAGLNIQF